MLFFIVYSAGVMVKSIVKGSTVDQDGRMHIGDIILSVSSLEGRGFSSRLFVYSFINQFKPEDMVVSQSEVGFIAGFGMSHFSEGVFGRSLQKRRERRKKMRSRCVFAVPPFCTCFLQLKAK